jgi:hypothetical protein
MREFYAPALGRKVIGLSFMAIGGDTLQALAVQNGSPAGWFSGAVRLGFEGCDDIYLIWKNVASGDSFLCVSHSLDWKPFSLSELPVWDGSWSEFIGSTLTAVEFHSLDGTNLSAVGHRFAKSSVPSELWVCVGNEQMSEVGEGDDIFVSQRPPKGLSSLKQLAEITA